MAETSLHDASLRLEAEIARLEEELREATPQLEAAHRNGGARRDFRAGMFTSLLVTLVVYTLGWGGYAAWWLWKLVWAVGQIGGAGPAR